MQNTKKRNPEAFRRVWESIIAPAIERYCHEETVTCDDIKAVRRRLEQTYYDANRSFSELYMADASKPLNQRKVAACYVQAILIVRPLSVDLTDEKCTLPPNRGGRVAYECRPCFANERLAIHTACSILTSFLRKALRDERSEMSEEELVTAEKYLKRGVDLLQRLDGGEYVLNLERSLSLMSLDRNYNLPLLACMFSYWEAHILPRRIYKKALRVFYAVSGGEPARRKRRSVSVEKP